MFAGNYRGLFLYDLFVEESATRVGVVGISIAAQIKVKRVVTHILNKMDSRFWLLK